MPSGSAGHGDEGRWMHALASKSYQRDADSGSGNRSDHRRGASGGSMVGGFDDDTAGSGMFDARGRSGASAAAATAVPFALQTLAELIEAIPLSFAVYRHSTGATSGHAAAADAVTLMATHVLSTAIEVGYRVCVH